MDKHQYQIQYTDNTYRMVEWTKKEFKKVCRRLAFRLRTVTLSDGVFILKDVRTIVFIPPIPEPTEEERKKEAQQQLTEWGFVDDDTAMWLQSQGINLQGSDS